MPQGGQIHLKSWLDRKKLYAAFVSDHGTDCLHYSRFTSLWNDEFPHVVIPPVRVIRYLYMRAPLNLFPS